jgi:putative ABC transport system permease protein
VTAGPVIRAASGGLLRRHLVQTVVIFLVLAASTAAATLGLTLLTNANEAFENGFAAHHGADVAVTVNSARVTSADLARTSRVPGVTKTAGPYPQVSINLQAGRASAPPGGGSGQTSQARGGASGPGHGTISALLVAVSRQSPRGPLDDIVINQGHWPTGSGQIAIAVYANFSPPIGSKVTVTNAPGKPQLTVVGYAGSTARYGDAWVTPGEAAALRKPGAVAEEQMLYTFAKAGTALQISADIKALKAVLPTDAITSYESWLGSADQTSAEQGLVAPAAVAFAILALVLAVLIVANVASAAVVAAYRRIGILKSIGFTPAQVTIAYVAQIGLPALAGCLTGAVLGNLWVIPMLNASVGLFQVRAQHVPVWVNATATLGMCALVGLATLVPAQRAGRLRTVQAITAGQAPRQGHGYAAHRLLAKVAVPRPVTIGLAAPLSRLARSAATTVAIMAGVIAVTLAVGLDSSLAKASQASALKTGQITITPASSNAGPQLLNFTASQAREAAAALRAEPRTAHYLAEADGAGTGFPGLHPTVGISGLPALSVTAYDGDPSWLGWDMISGNWYHRPGEMDVNTSFLTQTGLSVGDEVTLAVNGKPVSVRIVGQVFDPNLPTLFTSWQTLGGTATGLAVSSYDLLLKPGTNPQVYAGALGRELGGGFSVHIPRAGGQLRRQTDTSLIKLLTLLVAVLAGLGVLNSVLMATRERVHDLGVFKAVGMTPRQIIAMVVCWVVAPAIVAAIIALPVAIALHSVTMQAIGHKADTGIPAAVLAVYQPGQLLLLALSGLVIAAAGALLPANWAAASRTISALRAE